MCVYRIKRKACGVVGMFRRRLFPTGSSVPQCSTVPSDPAAALYPSLSLLMLARSSLLTWVGVPLLLSPCPTIDAAHTVHTHMHTHIRTRTLTTDPLYTTTTMSSTPHDLQLYIIFFIFFSSAFLHRN